jgi:hypothetical protein
VIAATLGTIDLPVEDRIALLLYAHARERAPLGDPLRFNNGGGGKGDVLKNGRPYDGNTLDEVWPRVRPLPNV